MKMLEYVEHLHNQGLGIHWLHPHSKRPLNKGWTQDGRESVRTLKQTYRAGFNVGVKLGAASKIGNGYLACIDIDYKHPNPSVKQRAKWRKEVQVEMRAAFPTVNVYDCIIVQSGRRNGSCHIYLLTDKPCQSHKVASSADKVPLRLLPPGKFKSEPPAWDLDFMSIGRQTALPPSIHPETKKTYIFKNNILKDFTRLPIISESDMRGKVAKRVSSPSELDLEGVNLNKATDLIKVEGVVAQDTLDRLTAESGDRSSELFVVAKDLVRCGFIDRDIALVLTDTDRWPYMAACGYEHASTSDRHRAINWVMKYVVAPARDEADVNKAFEDVEVTPLLSEAKAARQAEELVGGADWRDSLDRIKGDDSPPRNTLLNIIVILRGTFGAHFVRLNEFTGMKTYGVKTPWGGKPGREVKSDDLVAIKCWLAERWRFEPGVEKVNEALTELGRGNAWHPVRDYLGGLQWDGVERIDYWLRDYMGAVGPGEYLKQVSRKVLVAMVARIMEPGCKFDYMLILEGHQGIGKSTLLRHLAGDTWFKDSDINIQDKDAVVGMRGCWLWEIGELTGMRRADVNTLKQFMSRREDKIRVPYGRMVESFPRETVFIGTTNNMADYLIDETGNRRFWPVRLKDEYDFGGIKGVRDQLFAEAMVAYMCGETLYLEGKAKEQAHEEQEERRFQDSLVDEVAEFLSDPMNDLSDGVTTKMVLEHVTARNDRVGQMRVSAALRELGYVRLRVMINSVRAWRFVRKSEAHKWR